MEILNQKRTLFVSGLAEDVDERLLYGAFIPFGDSVEVQVSINPGTNQKRGYGFVEYEFSQDARAAMDNMHQAELCGKVLNVTIAKPQTHLMNKPSNIFINFLANLNFKYLLKK